MSHLERLKQKYPTWKVLSEPDPDCRCNDGEITTRSGRTQPCLCVCLSEIKNWSRADFCKEVSKAARNALKEMDAERPSATGEGK